MSDLEITKHDACSQWGLSPSQMERYFKEGMPHRREGQRKVWLPMPAALTWYVEKQKDIAKRQVSPTDYDDAKSRKMAAEAELAELELAKARDELMTRSDCERIVSDERVRVDARLQSLAPRLAGAVIGATSHNDALARVAPLIEECRDELRTAGPLDTEADDSDSD